MVCEICGGTGRAACSFYIDKDGKVTAIYEYDCPKCGRKGESDIQ